MNPKVKTEEWLDDLIDELKGCGTLSYFEEFVSGTYKKTRFRYFAFRL